MKQLITILLIIISLTSYSQGGKYPINVSGSGGGGGTTGGKFTTNDFGTLVDSATTNLYKIIVDTTVIASQARLSTMLALKLNIADTSSMLSGYQTAINARVKYTDTSSMLQKYRDSLFDYNVRISGNTTNIQRNTDSLPKRWGVYGNSGLSATTNFLGNTDNVPIKFRVNNVFRGAFDTATYDGNGLTGLLSLGNWLRIPTVSKSALFISDSSRLSGDEFRLGATVVVTGTKVGGTASQGQVFGANFEPRIGADNTQSWTSTYGMIGVRGTNNIQIGATGTLTYGNSVVGATDYGGMTITNAARFYGKDVFTHDGAVVTNNYGLYLENQSGGTNNYGIYLAAQTNNATNSGMVINAQSNQIVAGTITDTKYAFKVSGTFPSSITAPINGVDFQITGAGNSAQSSRAFNVDYLAGYTGSSTTTAVRFNNATAGTGASLTGTTANCGSSIGANATTTGYNIGTFGFASGGNLNVGGYGRTFTAKNSATNIGILGISLNTGSSPIQIGGAFYLGNTDPSFTGASSALLVDNGGTTSPIALFRDNGTVISTIADGGNMFLGGNNSTASARLQLGSGTTAASTAPLKLALVNPVLNTTAEKFAVEVDSATNGGKIYYTSADAVRNEIQLAAYGELYEDGGSTAITVTTAGTYYQWTTSTVGSSLLCTNSAATDNITVASGGGGTYLVNASVSFVGTNSATQKWAVFKNGSRLTNLTSVVHMAGSALQVTTSLTGLVALAATDTIDLRVTSDTNGDTATPAQVNLNITRLSK